MKFFTVAIPLEMPDLVVLVSGFMMVLRGLLGLLHAQGATFEEGTTEEGQK